MHQSIVARFRLACGGGSAQRARQRAETSCDSIERRGKYSAAGSSSRGRIPSGPVRPDGAFALARRAPRQPRSARHPRGHQATAPPPDPARNVAGRPGNDTRRPFRLQNTLRNPNSASTRANARWDPTLAGAASCCSPWGSCPGTCTRNTAELSARFCAYIGAPLPSMRAALPPPASETGGCAATVGGFCPRMTVLLQRDRQRSSSVRIWRGMRDVGGNARRRQRRRPAAGKGFHPAPVA